MNEPDYTPAEMMRQVEKLLGIGLETARKAPEMGLERVEEAICTNCGQWQHRSTGDCLNQCAARGFARFDQWAERREAFSNEGDALDDMLDNWDVEGLDDGEAQ